MLEGPSERYADAYGRAAASYAEVLDPTLVPVAQRIVDLTAVRQGDRLLDLATGTGVVAREAARRQAEVSGIDISKGMIALARDISPPSITFVAGDAGALPFGDAEFDVVTCGFGLSHMPDVPRVLQEVIRVLRPGGRFVESSWGAEGTNEPFAVTLRELSSASKGQLRSFADILDEDTWADPARGATLLRSAGFDVETVTEPLTGCYASPAVAVEWALAWPDYGETLASLDAVGASQFRRAVADAITGTDLNWWFAINYFIATRTEPKLH